MQDEKLRIETSFLHRLKQDISVKVNRYKNSKYSKVTPKKVDFE